MASNSVPIRSHDVPDGSETCSTALSEGLCRNQHLSYPLIFKALGIVGMPVRNGTTVAL